MLQLETNTKAYKRSLKLRKEIILAVRMLVMAPQIVANRILPLKGNASIIDGETPLV